MKIVVMCAGKSKRFEGFKPKPLANFQGQPNLFRTLDLLEGFQKIYVTASKGTVHYFSGLPSHVELVIGSNKYDTQRFSNFFPLDEETFYLYGDVVYHPKDLEEVMWRDRDVTTWFGRQGPNPLTGKDHGELMGVYVKDIERFETSVTETFRQFKRRERPMCIGWDVLEVHEGLSRTQATNFVTLSNYSDDYDCKQDLKNLHKVYERI